MNGVIEIATGDLIRAGGVDFTLEPGFDELTEAQRTEVPVPACIRKYLAYEWHRWTGTVWELHFDLRGYKDHKKHQIDQNSKYLIVNSGYDYVAGGVRLSTSEVAQKNMLFLFAMSVVTRLRDELGIVDAYINAAANALSWPYSLSTDDENVEYMVQDSGEAINISLLFSEHVLTYYHSGKELKKQVEAAVDKAGVDAVVDDRTL